MAEPEAKLDILWAPWRFSYLEKPNSSGNGTCIFVDLPNQNDDENNLILHRGKNAFVMLNAFPYASGHLMIVPFQHSSEIEDLPDETLLEINLLLGRSVAWLREAYHPEGFNIGANLGRAAGAGIPDHVHWHIVPRWVGDTNFMTAVAGTRVLPQSLPETYAKLRNAIAKLGAKRQQ